MNKLSKEEQVRVVACLVEGNNSIRATVRMTGASKNTIVKLLADLVHASLYRAHERIQQEA